MASLAAAVSSLTTDVNALQTSVTTVVIPGIQALEAQLAALQGQSSVTPEQIAALDTTVQNMKTELAAALAPPATPAPAA